jgi:monothiol glutaredoxin
MDEATRQKIQSVIDENEIVVFLKGSPQAPQCGFSAQVVSVLDQLGVEYAHVNVLADAGVRQAIKEFSDWPTIPQLYIGKEFVGGCDIVSEMFESGELEEKVGKKLADVPPPEVTVTPSAVAAFKDALRDGDEFVRFEINARFEHALSIGPRQPKDIAVEAGGLTLLLDRASAKRAQGATIDFVEADDGPAFKIDNPNEPPKVRQLTPRELKAKLDAGDRLELVDVRTDREREVARITGARALDRDAQQALLALPKDTPLVFLCHHGARSQQAAEFFLSHGFKNVANVQGGIDRWSQDVDPDVPRY